MTRFLLVLFVTLVGWAQRSPAAAQGSARIQITRPSSFLFVLPDAYIDVNGARVVNLANGDTYKGAVKPGPVTIVVTNWQAPGRSSVSFRAAPGKTYRFIVEPRRQALGANLALGVIGMAIEGGGMFQITPTK